MTLKSDAKFKEKLTSSFKNSIRNLVNFQPITQKSENFTSTSSFYPKFKYTEELSFMTLKSDAKLEQSLTL